jgi:peptidoglycan/LPS O-acetylase OafA/YrhL
VAARIWAGTFAWQQPALALNYKRFVLPFFCTALVGLFLFSGLRQWRSAIGEWLGDISYSVYLWHPLALVLTAAVSLPNFVLQVLVSLGLTLALSHASFHLIERPMMNLARRPARRN